MSKRQGAPPFEQVAGNGLLDRRALLGRGIMLAGAATAGVGTTLTGAAAEPLKDEPWSLVMGSISPPRQEPSRFEKNVVRTLSNPNHEFRNSHARTPHHLINGTVTPSPLHFTICHSGLADIDPEKHRLVIHGLVKQPKIFSLADLERYPKVTRMAFVECSGNSAPMFSNEPFQGTAQALHGLVSNSEWTGVMVSTLLEETGIDPKAKWFLAEGADSLALHRSVPVKKGLDDAMIALYQNGERIMPGNGYPMRLLLPGYQGNMNIKHVRRLKLIDQPAMSFYEAKTYSQILPGERFLKFNFVQQVKSFITHPSFGHSLKGPGYYEVSGVAYSGTGRIAKVMVSADGGKSWGQAALQGTTYPQAFTRFTMPWRWDGQPVVLQSRAWDEGGNAQPMRADFVAARGQTERPVTSPLAFPNQHYNSITSWGIDNKGRSNMSTRNLLVAVVACLAFGSATAFAQAPGLGKDISEADIKAWDIAVLPDGTNLPAGSGTPAQGAPIYAQKCAACHGEKGEKPAPGYGPMVGAHKFEKIDSPKTVTYYEFATTLFDVIRRSMPFTTPRTLTDNEVYAVTAYILSINKLIGETDVINAQTLPKVKMPNAGKFTIPYPDRI